MSADMDMNEIKRIFEENAKVLIKKNQDYGSANLLMTGVPGVAVRMLDKVSRLINLTKKGGNDINFESVEDTLNDLHNYSLLALLMKRGKLASGAPKLVYLAGPIDDVHGTIAKGWRGKLERLLLPHGIHCFDPHQAFRIGPTRLEEVSEQVITINRSAVALSDVLVANLSGEGSGVGTIREIEMARSAKKRVIVIVKDAKVRMALYDVEKVRSIREVAKLLIPRHG